MEAVSTCVPGLYLEVASNNFPEEVEIDHLTASRYYSSNYIYLDTIFGLSCKIALYDPLFASLLAAEREGVELLEPSSVTSYKREVHHKIEISGEHDPFDYMSETWITTIEDLFYDEDSDLPDIYYAIGQCLKRLLVWRSRDTRQFFDFTSSMRPISVNIHDSEDFISLYSRGGGLRRFVRLPIVPRHQYSDWTATIVEMDRYIADDGTALTEPRQEERTEKSQVLTETLLNTPTITWTVANPPITTFGGGWS